jgi:hypothetical protein
VEKELPKLPLPQGSVPHTQLAMRESGVWLDEHAQHYAYTWLLHAPCDNKRADQAMKCVPHARPDCAIVAKDIMCERMDCMSFDRSLSLLDNLMLRQRHSQSLSNYVHFMRQPFDDYNETCELIDGSAAIHPHNLGLLMLRGISCTGPFGQTKPCVINAFDTDYMLSADEVIASILHLAHNMDEEASAPAASVPDTSPLPSLRLSLVVAVHTTVADTTHEGLVVVVASPTSASHVAA